MEIGFQFRTRGVSRGRGRGQSGRLYSRYGQEVLEFFAMHRAALASQVRRQFPSYFGADRTVRLHLQTMVEAGELVKAQRQGIGEADVYLITAKGLRRASPSIEAGEYRRWRRRQTASHLQHELLITELAVSTTEAAARRRDLALPWQARFSLGSEPRLRLLVPDYGFLFKHASGQMICLVEVSSGEDSPTRIREKLLKYTIWSDSAEGGEFLVELYQRNGAKNARSQFRLLLVLQDRRTGNDAARLRQAAAAAIELEPAMQSRLWLTTVQQLTEQGSAASAVWIRGSDLMTAAGHLLAVSGRERSRLLDGELRALPLHQLFPIGESDDTEKQD